MSAFSYCRSRAPVFMSSVDDFFSFPSRLQQLLLVKPLIQTIIVLLVVPSATQTLAISEPNRVATESTLCVFPKALIIVLVVVFLDIQDFDKDLVFCSLSEDDFDRGLFFYPFLAWNRTLLPLLGLIDLYLPVMNPSVGICASVDTTKASDG